MITVNENLYSKLVSGGEPCLLTIDGSYGGYVKAGAAYQDKDGKFKVELIETEQPTPFVLMGEHLCYPVREEDIDNIVIARKKEVEHIDKGFEDLVYLCPEQSGFSIPLKTLTTYQIEYMHQHLPFDTDPAFFREKASTHISFSKEDGWFYSHPRFSSKLMSNRSFNDIFSEVV